jgi:DNA-binding transcriptional regulator YdaS (Cro superfamily)
MVSDVDPIEAFAMAITRAGGQSALARECGCTPGNISQLIKKGSWLPGRFVLKAEEATGVSRHLLRPDLYPRDVTSAAPLHGDVVSPGAPVVACDRSALLHRQVSNG